MNQTLDQPFSCIVIGNESLLIQCSEAMLQRGHTIRAVVSNSQDIVDWATGNNLNIMAPGADLANRLQAISFDWLFSIANLSVIPANVLKLARQGAINFHDGPLPQYAGLNTPAWAVINREKQHGITWHLMEAGVDRGDILEQRLFDVSDGDTALTLNTKCFEAALGSFAPLLDRVERGDLRGVPQNLSGRRYFAKADRPAGMGRLDFSGSSEALVALVAGLDHGNYWNPLCCAKIEAGGQLFLVGEAEATGSSDAAPGTVLAVSSDELVVATGSAPVMLRGITDTFGRPIAPEIIAVKGDALQTMKVEDADRLSQQYDDLIGSEVFWRKRLQEMKIAGLVQSDKSPTPRDYTSQTISLPESLTRDQLLTTVAAWVARVAGKLEFDLAMSFETANPLYFSDWIPVRFDARGTVGEGASFAEASSGFVEQLKRARRHGTFARDVAMRDPVANAELMPDVGLSADGRAPIPGTCITVSVAESLLYYKAIIRLGLDWLFI